MLQWGGEIWAGTERLQRRGCSKHPAPSFGMALGVWSASLHVVRSLYSDHQPGELCEQKPPLLFLFLGITVRDSDKVPLHTP